jgi:hypothetical protein
MIKETNLFVMTTEYHFLLTMSIIKEKFSSLESRNVLIFTGERLSAIVPGNIPNVEVNTLNVQREENLKDTIQQLISRHSLSNLFVFIAYRDLETYLLTTVGKSVNRHLVQDGANFYFKIDRLVLKSRLKETLKIYQNLWRKGIVLKKLVLFKTHMAQCGFVDHVWITNPEVYREPRFQKKIIHKINLLLDKSNVRLVSRYFGSDEIPPITNTLIYLSSRLTRKDLILLEISQLKLILLKLSNPKLLVKLHPNSSILQVELLTQAFGNSVLNNYIPAELYIAQSTNSVIIGGVTAALFFKNPACSYFTLVKIYQQLGLFPKWIEVTFPTHVKEMEDLDGLSSISLNF